MLAINSVEEVFLFLWVLDSCGLVCPVRCGGICGLVCPVRCGGICGLVCPVRCGGICGLVICDASVAMLGWSFCHF